jgi:hypothetical protein
VNIGADGGRTCRGVAALQDRAITMLGPTAMDTDRSTNAAAPVCLLLLSSSVHSFIVLTFRVRHCSAGIGAFLDPSDQPQKGTDKNARRCNFGVITLCIWEYFFEEVLYSYLLRGRLHRTQPAPHPNPWNVRRLCSLSLLLLFGRGKSRH